MPSSVIFSVISSPSLDKLIMMLRRAAVLDRVGDGLLRTSDTGAWPSLIVDDPHRLVALEHAVDGVQLAGARGQIGQRDHQPLGVDLDRHQPLGQGAHVAQGLHQSVDDLGRGAGLAAAIVRPTRRPAARPSSPGRSAPGRCRRADPGRCAAVRGPRSRALRAAAVLCSVTSRAIAEAPMTAPLASLIGEMLERHVDPPAVLANARGLEMFDVHAVADPIEVLT